MNEVEKTGHDNSSMEETEYGPSLQYEPTQGSANKTINSFCDWFGCWALHLIFLCSPFAFVYMCFKKTLWMFPLAYLLWMYFDRETPQNGGRRLEWLRKLRFWRRRRDYFPIKLVKTAELPSDTSYLFASFPHGFLTLGTTTNFLTYVNDFHKAFPGLDLYACSLDTYFKIPFLRELLLFLGVCSCTPKSIQYVLNGRSGNVAMLTVGGMDEMTKSFPGTNHIVLKNRKGFVKMALKAGASLVPVYTFGETDAYDQISSGNWYKSLKNARSSICRVRFVLFKGPCKPSHLFGLLPYQKPITTVVGKPIKLPKIENPSDELVHKYHEQFVREIIQLFDKYKLKYDSRGEKADLNLDSF